MTIEKRMPEKMFLGNPMASTVGQAMFEWQTWKEAGCPQRSERMVMGYSLPEWQRPFVWTTEQKIKLIESIWLGMNIGTYSFNRTLYESKFDNLLIDGQQRMKSLEDYLSDAFPVFGYHWSEVTDFDRRSFTVTRHFHSYILGTDDERFLRNYYNTMNFGGVAHTEDQRA